MLTPFRRTLCGLIAALALCACQKNDSDGAGRGAQAPGRSAGPPGSGRGPAPFGPAPAIAVKLQTLAPEEIANSISGLGTTNANESVIIAAKVTETVASINFDDGDVVKAGDVLVELSGKAELAALREAQAGYLEADQQLDRISDLKLKGTVTASQLDSARAGRDQAKARLDAVRARLSDRVITAPFSGVLGFRQVSPGTLLTPGTPIVTLDDVASLVLDFALPETELAFVREGDEIEARSSAYQNQSFVGVVSSIDSRVDRLSRAFTVRARLVNPKGDDGRFLLKPGMLLNVRTTVQPRMALMVDEIAVLQQGSEAFVYRFKGDDQSPERVPVEIGLRKNGRVEIQQGVQAGDRIVTEGNVKIRPGVTIKELADAPTMKAKME